MKFTGIISLGTPWKTVPHKHVHNSNRRSHQLVLEAIFSTSKPIFLVNNYESQGILLSFQNDKTAQTALLGLLALEQVWYNCFLAQ